MEGVNGPNIRTVQLENMRAVLLYYITEEFAKIFIESPQVEIQSMGSFIADGLVVRVKQDILGRELERIDARYPANWWEAFKDRWMPEWLCRRYPVRWTEVSLVAR